MEYIADEELRGKAAGIKPTHSMELPKIYNHSDIQTNQFTNYEPEKSNVSVEPST